MKDALYKLKTYNKLEWCLDSMSLLSVLQYCIYRFLQSTTFNFYYSNTYKIFTMGILIVFGGVRYLYIIVKKCKENNTHERKWFVLKCGIAWLLALPFFYVGWKHDYKFLIFLPICCMCLYNLDAGKVFRWHFFTIGICLASVVLCCLSNTVRNLVWESSERTVKRLVGGYGIINTTDFAAYFTFLLIIRWCSIRNKKWYVSATYAMVSALICYVVWWNTDSRTSKFSCYIFLVIILWDTLNDNVFIKWRGTKTFSNRINYLSVTTVPFVVILLLYLLSRTGEQSQEMRQMEWQWSGRLQSIVSSYQIYGINAFGNTIEKLHGNGGTLIQGYWSSGYSYIDVAYAMMAMRYGWVVTATIISLWIWMTIQALRKGNNRIAFTLAIFAVHGLSEARILDINYNILLVMPFCELKEHNREQKQWSESSNKKKFFTGAAIIIACYFFSPKLLSILRSFFYIEEWNSGQSAANAFLTCGALLSVSLLFWKNLSMLCLRRSKRSLVSVASLCLIIMSSLLLMSRTIEEARIAKGEQLIEERTIIPQIQESADQPVYAAEMEEIYRREKVINTEHLFSTEELAREKHGTILVDSNIEAMGIINAGGKYTQISEETGIYSFDPSVIDYLSSVGYNWTAYYSGTRYIDVDEMMLFNGKWKDRTIRSERIIANNQEIDQAAGKYEVTFTISKIGGGKSDDVCFVEIWGESGERLICSKPVKAGELDENGVGVISVEYLINPTPKVSYALSVPEGGEIELISISWHRSF